MSALDNLGPQFSRGDAVSFDEANSETMMTPLPMHGIVGRNRGRDYVGVKVSVPGSRFNDRYKVHRDRLRQTAWRP